MGHLVTHPSLSSWVSSGHAGPKVKWKHKNIKHQQFWFCFVPIFLFRLFGAEYRVQDRVQLFSCLNFNSKTASLQYYTFSINFHTVHSFFVNLKQEHVFCSCSIYPNICLCVCSVCTYAIYKYTSTNTRVPQTWRFHYL